MKFFTLVSSFIEKFDLLIPLKPSQSSNPFGCIISLTTHKSHARVISHLFGVVYNEITSCLKSYCSTSKNRTETARVSVLLFVQRSICRHFILSIFLASCISVSKRKRNLMLGSQWKTVLDSGLHPVDSGAFCQWNLNSWFQSLVGSLDYLSCIPDFKV